MPSHVITTGPSPSGHYSPAVRAGDLVFVSGQGPGPGGGSIADQTTRTLANLAEVARAAGGSLADAVKITVYLADIADFEAFDAAYAAVMPTPPPARATVGAALNGIEVEIDAVLHLPR